MSFEHSSIWHYWCPFLIVYLLQITTTIQELLDCSQLNSVCRNVTCLAPQPCMLIGYRIEARRHVVDVFLGDQQSACACSCSLPADYDQSESDEPTTWSTACQQLAIALSNVNISEISDVAMTRQPSHYVSSRITPALYQSMTLSHSRQVTSASLGILRQVLRNLTSRKKSSAMNADDVTPKTGSKPSYSRLLQEKLIEKEMIDKTKDDLNDPGLVVYDQSALSGSTIAMFVIILVIIMVAIILSFYSK